MPPIVNRAVESEGGFTLVEMLVTLAISSVVMAAVLTLIGSGQRATANTQGRVAATQAGRTAADQITQSLRGMTCLADNRPPLVSLTADGDAGGALVFYGAVLTATTAADGSSVEAARNFTPVPVVRRIAATRTSGSGATARYSIVEERWAGAPTAGQTAAAYLSGRASAGVRTYATGVTAAPDPQHAGQRLPIISLRGYLGTWGAGASTTGLPEPERLPAPLAEGDLGLTRASQVDLHFVAHAPQEDATSTASAYTVDTAVVANATLAASRTTAGYACT